jgi:hypothetical protein
MMSSLDSVPEPVIELHAPDGREVVALGVEEQVVEQVLGGLLGGRLAGAHHTVDLHQGLELGGGGIDAQGVGDVGPAVEVVHVQGADLLDALLDEELHHLLGDLVVGGGQQLAGFGIHDVVGENLLLQVLRRHHEGFHVRLLQVADVLGRDAAALLDDHLAADLDVEGGRLATQALGHQPHADLLLRQVEVVLVEEDVQHLLVGEAQGAQDDGDRQLAAAVDAGEQGVLRVEFEVQPGAPVGDDPRREQQLARGVRLALVVVEEHARRTVQLGDDDPLGAVDDERAVLGHQRQLAEVDLLLADVLHRLGRARSLLVVDDQAHLHPQRGGVGKPPQLAFLHVEDRVAEPVADILQRGVAGIADDREDRLERRVQPDLVPVFLGLVRLQELAVGVELNRQEIGHVQDTRTLAEVLADALLLCKGVSH